MILVHLPAYILPDGVGIVKITAGIPGFSPIRHRGIPGAGPASATRK